MRSEPGPVIVGYDGSDASAAAIHAAGPLLAPRAAVVVHVWDSAAAEMLAMDLSERTVEAARSVDEAQRRAAERIAADGAELARAAGFDAEPVALRGRPNAWPVLLGEADDRSAAVLVVGSRGRGGVRSALLGSVSAGVLHHSRRPVLVVPPNATADHSGPVLMAFDGSEPSRASVEAAAAVLGAREALVATVWMPYTGVAAGGALGAPADVLAKATEALDRETSDRAAKTAEEGARLASKAGMTARSEAVRADGSCATTLVKAATWADSPLIVTGSRGRSALGAAVLGSVSSALVHHARTPVFVGPR